MKVIVIGAGVMGLSTAWRLAKAGAEVHLLDSRPPGHGASLAALGALWPASPLLTGPLQTLHRQSLRQFEGFAAAVSEASRMPVSYRRLGRIEILPSAKAVARARKEAAADPDNLGVIDFSEARSLNAGLAKFEGAALHCRTTAQVIVREFVGGLVGACQNAGVIFHEATSVRGLLENGAAITGAETSAGRMAADAYLITSGAWTPQLSPLIAEVANIVPAKGQGIAVAMPAGRPLRTIVKSGPTYLIPWDEEILIGATTEPEAGFDETPKDGAREKLLAAATELLPELRGAKVLRHWAGLRPWPRRKPHYPVMGPHPRFSNLFLCAGHYRTGIGLSPLVSELMAEAILQPKLPPALAPFLPPV